MLCRRFIRTGYSFERKQYRALSHAPNKAMNLNSYLSLLGRHWRETGDAPQREMEFVSDIEEAHRCAPDADYIITLDADSLLCWDYALRLTHVMQQPGNERIGVIQTPYSSIAGAITPVEKTAGATTDMQYIMHQGFTAINATYWVGANALIRRQALLDISREEDRDGLPVRCFVHDRTVIEDTESSVDLIHAGWQLHNYPQRLSFSATPQDFGSLAIQRQRWANGGLIIFPKLIRYWASRGWSPRLLPEIVVRSHYLLSIALVNLSTVCMLFYPFSSALNGPLLPLTAIPYFFLFTRDLVQSGRSWRSIVEVYTLNLLLIPVNVAGVLKSLQQGLSRETIPFRRTPKVGARTSTAPVYLWCLLFGAALLGLGAVLDFVQHRGLHGIVVVINLLFVVGGITYFIGWPELREDILLGWKTGKEDIRGEGREPVCSAELSNEAIR